MDQAMIDRLRVLDKASQEKNAQALAEQRAKDGHVAVRCKCGAESVLDAKRPAKAPAAKCGVCGETL